MKNIVISADGDRKVYSVPDVVANDLQKYCNEFCNEWIWNSPYAKNIEHVMEYVTMKMIL